MGLSTAVFAENGSILFIHGIFHRHFAKFVRSFIVVPVDVFRKPVGLVVDGIGMRSVSWSDDR